MGLLVNGKWVDQWYDTASNQGRFVRNEALFRNWITPDGAPGPSGSGELKPKPGVITYMYPWPAHGRVGR